MKNTKKHDSDPKQGARSKIGAHLKHGRKSVLGKAQLRGHFFLPCLLFFQFLDVMLLSVDASGRQDFFRKQINFLSFFPQYADAVAIKTLL